MKGKDDRPLSSTDRTTTTMLLLLLHLPQYSLLFDFDERSSLFFAETKPKFFDAL